MQVEMLLPHEQVITLEELRRIVNCTTVVEPFDASVLSASIDLSKRIFHDQEARRHPELLALAYWMRKSEMAHLSAQFRSLQLCDRLLTPQGLVFHLPPRNVDTIFVYSWLLAALSGNRSVIRLSPERSESTRILLRLLRQTLDAARKPASANTIIISYGHEEEPTAMLSALCDVRVIWGGDTTIETIRRSPLPTHAREITFPDRYSLSAICTDSYAALSDKDRDFLANQFFNDSFWFDQLACSSPRLLVWIGTSSGARGASADFFPRVARCIVRHRYVLPANASMQKFIYASSAILNCPVEECRRYRGLTVLTLRSLAGLQRNHPGGGLFFEAQLDSLQELTGFLVRRDQTLTVFGFMTNEIHALVRNLNGRALDRIVSIGQALQFHRFWDGYDLLQEFCRYVYLEAHPPKVFRLKENVDPKSQPSDDTERCIAFKAV